MTNRSATQLREDALAIWRAGVDRVRSDKLVEENVRVEGNLLTIGGEPIDLGTVRRIVVVGAGKAGAGMAAGLERALGDRVMREKSVSGWVNVPDDCTGGDFRIHLHGARPAGANEPTAAGIAGTAEMRRLLANTTKDDVAIALISGGASALLPDPVEGVSLDDELAVARWLSGAGANIIELNAVRKRLSRLKAGGMARCCGAGRLFGLIISDVPGDPLETIASGPTVPDASSPAEALAILERFGMPRETAPAIFDYLNSRPAKASWPQSACAVSNLILGNNALAVDGAGEEAERRGYSFAMTSATAPEGNAEDVGRHLAAIALRMRDQPGPDCLISGGEPVVTLVPPERRGRGGRNQQLVLAAMQSLFDDGGEGIAIVSGGTDGEDGPTDAAGAGFDARLIAEAKRLKLDPASYLAINDAYPYFRALGALIETGPTHTNVSDLRVIAVSQRRSAMES
jgi:hydroxypyruvate reductase